MDVPGSSDLRLISQAQGILKSATQLEINERSGTLNGNIKSSPLTCLTEATGYTCLD